MAENPLCSNLNHFALQQAKVLVVGDVMLDRYWQGTTERISPEAPVPVVKVNDRTMRVGGAGNVAVNITSLGGQASLLAMVGEDEAALDLANLLKENQVTDYCVADPKVSTTIKLRILAQHQQLIRLDFEANVSHLNQQKIIQAYEKQLSSANLVVLSDYGKGVITNTPEFIKKAQVANVKVLVDPKKDDFTEYHGAYLVTPNKKEFEAIVGTCTSQSDLEDKAHELVMKHDFGGILVTQGADGMTLVMANKEPVHFSTHAQEVYDVTGAGDTVIATLAASISAGLAVKEAVQLSCVSAGIVVGRIGTAKVTQQDLIEATQKDNKLGKVCEQDELFKIVNQAKKQGQKVVMTNGCFDILHAGHVDYLTKSAALGDIFIVAVNSDASVTQLKGETRPINPLDQRMAVLSGLASIDYVVAFNEETPEQLICTVKPDVLVKGGDYTKEQIAGHTCVKDVVIMDLVQGQSTTNIVSKINNK